MAKSHEIELSPVVDSSAILAILFKEPGATRAMELIGNGLCSMVNLTEIMTRCVDRRLSPEFADDVIKAYSIAFADHDEDLARIAAGLRSATRHKGLSLGDRACLALAIRENATVITTDRAWADLDVGCKIEVIR
ncbi:MULTISPECIES: type II toxin-antitoxin system VapC family toxin [Phyllobacterium]|uniref:type II toxin-antitoxin system VapC family toxin n=1 Tax=Phyllobacterium TaxID=28100 RepID=UPI001FE034F3|nr:MULTISPECIES: type II toxin-antitoxin system VapC family toxin [Phyllobacterium]UXN63500.1 type II toxin-antitoxin system VapC family toxin [Phyllobacterium sp. A18/5-2]